MTEYTATYSPEDNKLRLYSLGRLPRDLYDQVKGHGFIWAPKQELFVAPAWTPSREDFLIELCGEIDDEDTSLVDRAEQRADRFEDYSDKRANDAERAREGVSAIADHIPLGQPILVGHHSERHARRDAKRIEDGMRRAVKMWETSEYWVSRAKGALRHAKYKELPGVRARRIKGLEADKRKQERSRAQATKFLKTYQDPEAQSMKLRDGRELIPALLKTYEGGLSYEDQTRFERDQITFEEAKEKAVRNLSNIVAGCDRWIAHISNRLTYEKAMLEDQGASELLKPKARPVLLPICNYHQDQIVALNPYHSGETLTLDQVELTSAEYKRIHSDYKGTYTVENSHRVRMAMSHAVRHDSNHGRLVAVFLTDSKVHAKPEAGTAPEPKPRRVVSTYKAPEPKPEAAPFEAMKASLAVGVQVVSAPQLFPTPPALASRMAELAELEPGLCVLEPSAGTGNLVQAVLDRVDTEVLGYEINAALCSELSRRFPSYQLAVKRADFLEVTDFQGCYPRILMNPPFANGQDIKHIQHARTFLKPGGRLVALCANGPRQRAALQPIADTWEDLPAGTFNAQGTNINVALLVITSGG